MKIYYKRLCNFTQEEFDKYFSMMDDGRKSAVMRMRIENDRRRSVLGEMLARRGISLLCGREEKEITFARTEKGKPLCTSDSAFFNVSHCNDIVVCVIDSQNVGIDIEKVRRVEMQITRIACTDNDREFIFGQKNPDPAEITPTPEILDRIFTVWTAKEAYFKFIGIGIVGMRTVSYSDILPNCSTFKEKDYILSVYGENGKKALEFEELV